MRFRGAALVAMTLGLVAWPPARAATRLEPDAVEGLVAWYAADAIERVRGGAPVSSWEDRSGNGHHLTEDRAGQRAIFTESQLNGRPVVRVRKGVTFAVTEPFELAAHTIVLVHRSDFTDRALFRSAIHTGLVLGVNGTRHQYSDGETGRGRPYTVQTELPKGYAVTVLGREQGGKLRAFVDGNDVSGGVEFPDPVRVGKLFELKQTQFTSRDGEGLWLAEMAFYDRFLADDERESVTAHLAAKYGLAEEVETAPEPPAAPPPAPRPRPDVGKPATGGIVQLRTVTRDNVNAPDGVDIPWTIRDELDRPFAHDTERKDSRLCVTDPVRVRLSVALPLRTEVPDAHVQLAFLIDATTYLEAEGRTGPFVKVGDTWRATLRGETIAVLDGGSCVQVTTWQKGAPGEVTVEPRKAVFIAEVK